MMTIIIEYAFETNNQVITYPLWDISVTMCLKQWLWRQDNSIFIRKISMRASGSKKSSMRRYMQVVADVFILCWSIDLCLSRYLKQIFMLSEFEFVFVTDNLSISPA